MTSFFVGLGCALLAIMIGLGAIVWLTIGQFNEYDD
jgi:hypothetical protein